MANNPPSLLDRIPFSPDAGKLAENLHLVPDSGPYREFHDLVRGLKPIARPKAVYREAFITDKDADTVTIESVTFTSAVLRQTLEDVNRVFPYVITCGMEMDEAVQPGEDYLLQFWLDAVKADALKTARQFFREHIRQSYGLEKTSSMNPGSGDADVWPIAQQQELFRLLGPVRDLTGVILTDSCLMQPNKTVSGILFPAEKTFSACRLCHREDCPGRGAEFDRKLWIQYHPET